MRLREEDARAIRREVIRLDPGAEVYLYGSRVDDRARGGDIDLLVVSDHLGFRDLLRLRSRILDAIGWQQLDITIRGREELGEPMTAEALQTGIRL